MKHLHKIFISLTLLLCTLLLNAQKGDRIKNSIVKKESFLTVDLFSSLNTYSPRWRVGYVKSIHPKWKVGLNLGYGNKNISHTYFADKFEEDYELWEIRPELYKILKRNTKVVKYFSLELFYINHKDIFHNKFYFPEDGEYSSYDQADYQRHKYGFNINIGEFVKIGKCFGLNIFTGAGLRIRDNSFTNILNPQPADYGRDMIDPYQYREFEGLDFGFNYSIGLKLLFR